ncbi:discoidin domain-containing receptor 2-like protein, partial [Lasius niger]
DNALRLWVWRTEKSPMKTSRRVLYTILVSDRNMPG